MYDTTAEYYTEHNIPHIVVGNHVIRLDELHKTYSVYVNSSMTDYEILSKDSEAILEVARKLQFEGYTLFYGQAGISCECGCTILN